MQLDGVDGLNTVGMWADDPATLRDADEVEEDCELIVPDRFRDVITPSIHFQLWDGVVIANGIVTHPYSAAC